MPSHSKVRDDPLLRRDLAEASLEAVRPPSGPCSTKRQWPPRSTSMRSITSLLPRPHHCAMSVGLGVRAPDAVARRVELALDADLAIGGGRERVAIRDGSAWLSLPWSARGTPRGGRVGLPASAGTSRSTRPRPSGVAGRGYRSARVRPSSSARVRRPRGRCTCFFMPVRVMSNASASSVIEASRRPSRSRIPRRVGSARAAKAASR